MKRSQEQQFDDQLRQSLEAINPSRLPGSWEQLSSKLDNSDLPFDAVVRDSLAPLAENLEPKGWDDLAQELDRLRTDEADQLVQERLEDLERFSRPSGWATLAAHLELIAYRRQSLAAIKLTELCLAISLLLLFWRFAPIGTFTGSEDFPISTVAYVAPTSSTHDSVVDAEVTESNSSIGEEQIISYNNAETSVGSDGRSSSVAILDGWQEEALVAEPEPSFSPGVANSALSQGMSVQPAIHLASNQAIERLDFELVAAQRDQRIPNPPVGLLDLKEKNPIQSHLRVFYSPVDINQVITPENAFFDRAIQRDNRLTYGTSAGLLVDISTNKYTVQTGLIYGLRSYIPTLLKVTESEPLPSPIAVNRSGYSKLEFHTVSVPFTINRTVVDDGRWRITVGAGAGLNMILSSSFTKIEGADQILNDLLNGGGQARGGFQDRVDAREYFNPEPGWFQGGSIFSNANFYFIGTASFERRLNDRLSLFAAPTINRSFHFLKKGGVGPNFDRIHNHSIQLGARMRLGAEK
ncbi:MAG: hypothetical protein AAF433_02420 [Bacteroidota bacterium]